MKIVNREDFLKLPANTVYCKYGDGPFGEIEIKASDPQDDWGNDYVVNYLNTYCETPFDKDTTLGDIELGTEFRFDENQTSRDGLYDYDQLFAVFDNDDIMQVVDKLMKCVTS